MKSMNSETKLLIQKKKYKAMKRYLTSLVFKEQ